MGVIGIDLAVTVYVAIGVQFCFVAQQILQQEVRVLLVGFSVAV